MAGVYIPGMEMPKNCYECKVERLADCDPWRGTIVEKGKRYANCPLIPVPDHGDLIDRDALLKEVEKFAGNHWTVATIKKAQTIIPADDGFYESLKRGLEQAIEVERGGT